MPPPAPAIPNVLYDEEMKGTIMRSRSRVITFCNGVNS